MPSHQSNRGPRKKTQSSFSSARSLAAKKAAHTRQKNQKLKQHILFFPLLTLTLILWVLYRALFPFPIWFDEIIAKAIFFGFPVWIYITVSRSESIPETFAPGMLKSGLLLGIAIGGIFGFATSIMGVLINEGAVQAAPLFVSNLFWWEFFLAMITAFWETLFFFSWVMTVIMERFGVWPLINKVILTAVIFTAFHVPNTILRFSDYGMALVVSQALLLFFFAVGQALIFSRWKNFYALVITHAIWGMVLLVHVTQGL